MIPPQDQAAATVDAPPLIPVPITATTAPHTAAAIHLQDTPPPTLALTTALPPSARTATTQTASTNAESALIAKLQLFIYALVAMRRVDHTGPTNANSAVTLYKGAALPATALPATALPATGPTPAPTPVPAHTPATARTPHIEALPTTAQATEWSVCTIPDYLLYLLKC